MCSRLHAKLLMDLGFKATSFFITPHYCHLCSFTFRGKAALRTALMVRSWEQRACLVLAYLPCLSLICKFIVLLSSLTVIERIHSMCRDIVWHVVFGGHCFVVTAATTDKQLCLRAQRCILTMMDVLLTSTVRFVGKCSCSLHIPAVTAVIH